MTSGASDSFCVVTMTNDAVLGTEHGEIERRVVVAIDQLLLRDGYLLLVGASERAITHRLARYLEDQFPEWDVDAEYNRDGADIKRDVEGTPVLPDIIVHRRGSNDNLLVIEVKKSIAAARALEDDYDKLREFISPQGLGYRWGLHVVLPAEPNRPVRLRWFPDGA